MIKQIKTKRMKRF